MRLENTPTTSCVAGDAVEPGSRTICPWLSNTALSRDSFPGQRLPSSRETASHTNSPVKRLYCPGLHPRLALLGVIHAWRAWKFLAHNAAKRRVNTNPISGSVCRRACPASTGASCGDSPGTTAGPSPTAPGQDHCSAGPCVVFLACCQNTLGPRRLVRCPCGEAAEGSENAGKRWVLSSRVPIAGAPGRG